MKAYQILGKSDLERREDYKTYSVQFKLDVLHYKLRKDESYQDVALKFGIFEPSIVTNWMRIWNKEGVNGASTCVQKN